jgi:hypothetical protein
MIHLARGQRHLRCHSPDRQVVTAPGVVIFLVLWYDLIHRVINLDTACNWQPRAYLNPCRVPIPAVRNGGSGSSRSARCYVSVEAQRHSKTRSSEPHARMTPAAPRMPMTSPCHVAYMGSPFSLSHSLLASPCHPAVHPQASVYDRPKRALANVCCHAASLGGAQQRGRI